MPRLLVLDEGCLVSENPIAVIAKGNSLFFFPFLFSHHVVLPQSVLLDKSLS